jgi:DUF1365 family protein
VNLYTGTVRHRRFHTKHNDFTYRVAYAYVDLEALPRLRGPVRFRAADYLTGDAARAQAGTTGPVRLLTTPRTFGLIFNPVSFYYGFADDGETLDAVLAEVTNTPWGEKHVYLAGEELRKRLHVSPLMGMDQTYRFAAPRPGPTLSVHIESTQDGERAFDATLNLRRRPFSVRPLLRGTPLRTLPLIYAHAMALRLRGVPSHPHPA